ncbi:acyl-CoA dehydrogenase (plasmid) [Acaryochloris sp. 'Moss Beach']|uniref:acyl-CoA dehydrogenase n=1 Tax=Acaryochloris TaxID=155977 RepID=UPI001BAEFEF7|nr:MULTISPECIES: acyl-CoA dehydrogenase [Acaryochloris]QUY46101.1 acyl-CoA dehydrogenase [Acaryochloris marina S15]UJB72571.1 acyl-CoA dehydrogenase [Acaryochloris sp. 'Moss Beach']
MTLLISPITTLVLLFVFILLGYLGVPLWIWTLYVAVGIGTLQPSIWIWSPLIGLAVVINWPLLRRLLLTSAVVKLLQSLQLFPKISSTEQAAIEAGNVWVDGEFFTGKPNFERILSEPYPQLNPEIQAFLDGPVEQVCRMASDWEIYQRQDLPPDVWTYLKQERFFGMMIPEEYGGLGFSNLAYSAVMAKLASRSFTHVATVGVTNSLGPAKLLLRYGTKEQKNQYLPRLASGEDIPCFALTEPKAGSDAASITSSGVVFKGDDGQLYLKLNWNKRYITLGAIATLLGLAFQLHDPDNLLGKGEHPGITCALIPTETPGVIHNRRHDPMGVPFYNSPLEGHDVMVPIGQIMGGIEQAGQGWKMIMQTLAAGRGISFPATCTGVTKLVARVAGAHAVVRKQFGLSISRFEGVEEPLARIGGFTYMIDAVRLYTCGAVDQGEQPAVISAIAKSQTTELARRVVLDGMDILGGAGICRGPRNLLANIYTAIPIAITVEGANILTRSLMIFGQGTIRSHPYIYDEILAIEQSDVAAFDQAFWSHLGLIVRNGVRAGLLCLTRGRLTRSPVQGETAIYYHKLAWAAATFANLSDLAMLSLGGALKRRENLTGRFADMLAWMYLGSATLRRFEAEGQQVKDLPLVHWSMQYAFAQIQQAVEGVVSNLPILSAGLRQPILGMWRLSPLGTVPSDELGHQATQILLIPGPERDRLTRNIYLPNHTEEAVGHLEEALRLSVQTAPILKTIKNAIAGGRLPPSKPSKLVDEALEKGIINLQEATSLQQAEISRSHTIQVDSFTLEEYQQKKRISQIRYV